ncbi:hypothetical protein PAV_3c02700 [Paenibacillus alvei DSM 29]|uniref:hypothetical protein n=1 Tax=Paenibacillus alvei TaxID=44250 RepID=UPI0002886E7A|nr:hypothetical protein [Paenibacillus alvei]EJW17822.1 hypothetical protein PAV_3c02700 [Paenibacillus alvei DSM 29]
MENYDKKIAITTDTREEMNKLVRSASIDMSCGGPNRQPDGTFVIEAYVPDDHVNDLSSQGYRYEILEHISRSMLEQRQQEVGNADRYEGGNVAPQGTGIKR